MTARREQVLDAAITVLGQHGVHGVTHRAVDAAAGVPQGTTSNYFRTRDALLEGVVGRFSERERAAFEELAAAAAPTTALELAANKLRQARDLYGSQSVGVMTSAKCTNEENYLMNKFARQVLGTNSIDHCARL